MNIHWDALFQDDHYAQNKKKKLFCANDDIVKDLAINHPKRFLVQSLSLDKSI